MSQVVGLLGAAPHELAPGVTMRPLFGDGAMLNLLEFEPGSRVAPHDHPHEQLGYVVEGELVLAIPGVEHRLGSGDGYQIPGGESVLRNIVSVARGEMPEFLLDRDVLGHERAAAALRGYAEASTKAR